MNIKELKHSVQAVISTGPYENQRESFEISASIKEGENPESCMQELETFNHRRLDAAVNAAKVSLVEKQYSSIRFRDFEGKKYPSVTSILSWDTDWRITPDELSQYGARGTIIHKVCEIFLKDGKWVEPEDIPELSEEVTVVNGGSLKLSWKDCSHKKFFEEFGKDIEVISLEKEIYNKELLYSGRYDILGTYKGKRAILDIKSGSTKDFRQLAAYAVCEDDISSLVVLPVGQTKNKCGFMKPIECTTIQAEFKEFVKARESFRSRFGI